MQRWLSHLAIWAGWLLKALFTCNHLYTPVKEGKCFCPNCGHGIVFQWVVLRCGHCRVRRDSRYYLRQVLPAQACCAHCGESDVRFEYLDMSLEGAYFQLSKARLTVQKADEYVAQRFSWSATASAFNDTLNETLQKTRAWLDPGTKASLLSPVLISSTR